MILNLSLNIHYESHTTIMAKYPYFSANVAQFRLILI